MKRISHVIGFDDAPFSPTQRKVQVVGAVFSGLRLVGVLCGEIERDGDDATETLSHLVLSSKFASQIQAVLIQGIAMGGFNVVDLQELHRRLGVPVIAVARKKADMDAIRRALLTRIPHGAEKWERLQHAGPMQPMGHLYAQFVGIEQEEAGKLLASLAVNGHIPEPLRTAHLIAGAIGSGESKGRT